MKSFILAALAALSLTACTNYGKKVKSGNIEVYYKDGVNEEQAKKTASLFYKAIQATSPGNSDRKSFQLTKPADTVMLKMVIDKSKISTTADESFYAISGLVSDSVFAGNPVNITLTDNSFKPLRTLAFKKIETPANDDVTVTRDDFDHDTEGGVDFYWNGISDEESKTIADYIVKDGSFSGGTAEIYMTKKGDRYILRFPMKAEALSDPAYISVLDKVTKDIKDNMFPNVPFSFYATDKNLVTVKSWDY